LLFIDPNGMESESYGSVGTLGKYKEQYEIDKQEFVQQHQKAQEEQNGMAIFVAFPDANPAIPSNQKLAKWWESVFDDGDGKYQAGHAGVVLIDEEGDTNYFDFGRYDRPDIEDKGRGVDEGAVRSSKNYSSLRVPNWNFDNPDNVNVNGGAIALGHPLGCTGAKLSVQLFNEMKRRKLKYGMVSACVGGGQGVASIYELM